MESLQKDLDSRSHLIISNDLLIKNRWLCWYSSELLPQFKNTELFALIDLRDAKNSNYFFFDLSVKDSEFLNYQFHFKRAKLNIELNYKQLKRLEFLSDNLFQLDIDGRIRIDDETSEEPIRLAHLQTLNINNVISESTDKFIKFDTSKSLRSLFLGMLLFLKI